MNKQQIVKLVNHYILTWYGCQTLEPTTTCLWSHEPKMLKVQNIQPF